MDAKLLVVVMGVSGSGKSTIGTALAHELDVPFVDGDDLHPRANVDKMHAGHPLTDDDRWPWLAQVGRALQAAHEGGLVIACSALKRRYREAILREEPRALFLHLAASHEVIADRLAHRSGHFMPPALLDSQFDTLEPLAADEPGVAVDVGGDIAHVVHTAAEALRTLQRR